MLSNLSFGSASNRPSQLHSPNPASPGSPTSAVFTAIDDELRDIRRVHSQGQEEDLRYALDRVIHRVEDLSSLLKTAYKTQTELETQLNLAKSNLQLVISNNEMLEEALKRETPSSARDVGWRRWSAREVQNIEKSVEDERPRSLDYGSLNESGTPSAPSGAVSADGFKSGLTTPNTLLHPPTPLTSQESRFFKFRFNSGSKSPHPSHLTSPSLPSLVSSTREKEFEELQEELLRERQAHKAAVAAKAALEAELESLSQALFEEANKMVATERIKRAETEEELSEMRKEKDALREALCLIEGENGRLRSVNSSASATFSDRTEHPENRASYSPLRTPPDEPTLTSRSTPSPKAPPNGKSAAPSGRNTPPVASLHVSDMPGHLTGFTLEPAPKALFGALHRKTQSREKPTADQTVTGPPNDSTLFNTGFVTSPPVSLIPDEPSPWADAVPPSI
ncbi:hypothetical protein F5I97DRAFT_1856474 [Phlebopus sp. FC_14]|nr:hypothetical protein F5I97DRAFT_1856474 [Phlebopus sp. FC_14]